MSSINVILNYLSSLKCSLGMCSHTILWPPEMPFTLSVLRSCLVCMSMSISPCMMFIRSPCSRSSGKKNSSPQKQPVLLVLQKRLDQQCVDMEGIQIDTEFQQDLESGGKSWEQHLLVGHIVLNTFSSWKYFPISNLMLLFLLFIHGATIKSVHGTLSV